jgi:soluble lytic murein transglycosylase-like protein
VSRSGACGLTQVLPKYVGETCDQLKIPTTSIRVGTASLKKWTTIRVRRDGKLVRIPRPGGLRASLACYNAGYACLKSTKGRNYADSILAKSAKIAEIIQQNQRKDGRQVSPEPMIFYQGANTVLAYTPWYDGGPAEQYVPIYVPGYSP